MAFDISKNVKFVMSLSGDDKVKAAVKGVQDGFWDTDRAINAAKAAFVGLAGVASVAAFKNMVLDFIDASGALHDLSIQTGMSAAALFQFKEIGAYTNTALESIAGASLKLSKNLAGANEESKGAAQAIKALGLDFDAFKKLNPDEQMLEVAKAMAQFEDGSGKSAAAMMLLGKEGAKMLPFLADLAEEHKRVEAALTDEEKALRAAQTAMADAFGDNLTAIRKNSEGWKRELSLGLLPALFEASEVFKEMFTGTGGLRDQIAKLAKDGTLAEWARGAVTAMSMVADVVQAVWRIVESFVKFFTGTVAALVTTLDATLGPDGALARALKGDFSGSLDALKAGFRQVGTIAVETGQDVASTWGKKLLGQQFRDRMADLKGVEAAAKPVRKALDLSEPLDSSAKAAQRTRDEYAALNSKIADLILKQQAEIESGHKLTDVDKLILEAKRTRTGAELEAALAALAVAKANESVIETEKRRLKAEEDALKGRDNSLKALEKEIDKLTEQSQQQALVNETLATGVDRTDELAVARLRDAAASAERSAIIAADKNLDFEQYELFKQQAVALRQLADLKEQGIHLKAAKEANDEWKKTTDQIGQGLTDSLYRAFESGKGFFSTLWSGIKNTFKTTTLRLVVDTVMKPVNQVLNGLLFGSGGAAAGGGSGGLLGGLMGGLMSKVGGLFGGGGSAGGILGSWGSWGVDTAALTKSIGSFGPWGALIALGMGAAGKSFDAGFSHDNLPATKTALATGNAAVIGMKFDTNLLEKLGVDSRTANIITGAALWSRVANWGAGTPHRGSVVTADADGARTGGYDPTKIMDNFSAEIDTSLKTLLQSAVGVLNTFGSGFRAEGAFAADKDDPSFGNLKITRDGVEIGRNFRDAEYESDPKKGFEAYTADVALSVREALKAVDLPQWAQDMLAAIGDAPAMDALLSTAAKIQETQLALAGLSLTLAPMGGIFAQIATLSSDAKMELAGMVGGIEQLVAKSQSFVQAYYSQGEQASIAARNILEQVQKAGVDSATYEKIAGLTDKTGFRALLESVNVNTAGGLDLAALGLNIAQPFAQIADYLKESGKTLGEMAREAIMPAVLQLTQQAEAAASEATSTTAEDPATTAAQDTAESTAATAESMAAAAAILERIAASTADTATSSKAQMEALRLGMQALADQLERIDRRVAEIEDAAALHNPAG